MNCFTFTAIPYVMKLCVEFVFVGHFKGMTIHRYPTALNECMDEFKVMLRLYFRGSACIVCIAQAFEVNLD